MKTLEVIQTLKLPDNLEDVMPCIAQEVDKIPFIEHVTKVSVAFRDEGIRMSTLKANNLRIDMSRMRVELYPHVNNLTLYLRRRNVREHFNTMLEDVADYHRIYLTVPNYLLDFKELIEEEKIYCIECINQNYRFEFDLDKHTLTNKLWIREHDFEFYHKYKLLIET